jgi:hypothetical protein
MTGENRDELDAVEIQLPPASGVAFAQARIDVLAAGLSVLQSRDNTIEEIFPDGSRRFVKFVDPPISVEIGRKFRLK